MVGPLVAQAKVVSYEKKTEKPGENRMRVHHRVWSEEGVNKRESG
jgi:hypothetical protein